MALGKPDLWARMERVEADLGDVFGTPGFDEPGELAEQLAVRSEGPWTQMSAGRGLFLAGAMRGAPPPPQGRAGAFGLAAAPCLNALNDHAPGHETPFDGEDVIFRLTSLTGSHMVAQQRLRGAEVVGARYRVHADDRGNVAITGTPLGSLADRDPGEPPPVPPEHAALAVRERFGVPFDVPIGVQRVVFPLHGAGVWAFETRFALEEPPTEVRAFVRADDMNLLLSYNVASSALFGEAEVFPINPLRTPDLQRVRLERLGPQPSDRLTGAAIDVRPKRGDPLVVPLRDARLEPGDAGFEEVSAYHHVWSALRWCAGILGEKLFESVPFAPLRVVVGDASAGSDAFFLPGQGQLVFGRGPRPPSRSAEVVFHEFGHAISDAVCRLNRSAGKQAKGLSEGYSDYLAATAFDDPRFGDWVMGRADGFRNCAKAGLRFPAAWEGEEHATGEVWASVLWGIRQRVGAQVSDLLVLESLQFLGPQSTFEDGCAALLSADRQLFPAGELQGRHADIITEEFDARRPD